MLSRIVVGTLTTLNTMMSPLAGSPEKAKTLTFKLEAPLEQRLACPSLSRNPLILKVEPAPDSRLHLGISGRICGEGKKTELVSLGASLPAGLFDSRFIEELPTNIPYVVSESAFGVASKTGLYRLKLTKREPIEGTFTLRIEWIPAKADEKPQHEPITLWLRKLYLEDGTPKSELIWERIEARGLKRLSGESLALIETETPETPARKVQ